MASRDGGGAAGDDAYSRRRRRRRAVTAIAACRRGLGGRLEGEFTTTSRRLHGDSRANSGQFNGNFTAIAGRLQGDDEGLQRATRGSGSTTNNSTNLHWRADIDRLQKGLTSSSLRNDFDWIPKFDGDSTA